MHNIISQINGKSLQDTKAQQSIQDLRNRVATDESNIEDLQISMTDAEDSITKLTADVNTNATDIATNTQDIASNATGLNTQLNLISNKVDKLTTSGTSVYSHTGSTQSELGINVSATANTIPLRSSTGAIYAADATTEHEVVTLGQFMGLSDLSYTYSGGITLDDPSDGYGNYTITIKKSGQMATIYTSIYFNPERAVGTFKTLDITLPNDVLPMTGVLGPAHSLCTSIMAFGSLSFAQGSFSGGSSTGGFYIKNYNKFTNGHYKPIIQGTGDYYEDTFTYIMTYYTAS